MTTQPVPKNIMAKEPALSIGASASAILVALFGVLRASGVGITDDLSDSVTALVLALCAVPAVSGWLTRFFVYSPASTQALVNDAATTGQAADTAPPPPKKATTVPVTRWGVNQ